MATDEELLLRFMPKVCYDSLEAFFADHPLQMLVNPGNTLRREPKGGRDGELLATAPNIELGWPKYPDGKAGAETDRLGIKGRDYRTQYVALRKARPDLKNKLVARAVRDPDSKQLWLQYWLWYIYNDYHLAFNAGLHEGDWEMVQLGMDGEQPELAVSGVCGVGVRPKVAAALAWRSSSWLGVGHQADSKPAVSQPARRDPAS
jgi:hypothetical protein